MDETVEIPPGEAVHAALERLDLPAGRFTIATGRLQHAVLGYQDLDAETYRTITVDDATVDSIEGAFRQGDGGHGVEVKAAAVLVDSSGQTVTGRLVEAYSAGDVALTITSD